MGTLLKKKWFIPSVAMAVIAMIGVLVWSFFQDSYLSIKDIRANPPFEGVYWGMTIPEFCEAMGVEESDLVEAEAWTYDDIRGSGQLKRYEELYGTAAEDMPLYEYYENHFDLPLNRELLGTEDYYLGDKPQTIRVVFTDETTWNGKTIPPLLCYIVFQVPEEMIWAISNELSLFYDGTELDKNSGGIGIGGGLVGPNLYWPAHTLSEMYSCGMSPEEIAAYKINGRMNREKIAELNIICPVYEAVHSSRPQIEVQTKFNDFGWPMDPEEGNVYVYMEAGYTAYYEWFLNELT